MLEENAARCLSSSLVFLIYSAALQQSQESDTGRTNGHKQAYAKELLCSQSQLPGENFKNL